MAYWAGLGMVNTLEATIRSTARELANHQIARIWKWPEALEKTGCDFFGYTRTARVILIEAKQVTRSTLPIGKSPGLLPHQWIALQECDRAGGIALVAWQRRNEVAVIDVSVVNDLVEGRKSIAWGHIPERFKKNVWETELIEMLDPFLPV